jgi:hypothetical protein
MSIAARAGGRRVTSRPPADVGMPVGEIDTPALVVDLDVYERNLDRMAASLVGTPVRLGGPQTSSLRYLAVALCLAAPP